MADDNRGHPRASRAHRHRPVEHVVRDIEAVARLRPQPFIEFADDNTFADRRWGKALGVLFFWSLIPIYAVVEKDARAERPHAA